MFLTVMVSDLGFIGKFSPCILYVVLLPLEIGFQLQIGTQCIKLQ